MRIVKTPAIGALAGLLAALAIPAAAGALEAGQRDDFEDGTTQNWTVALLGVTHPAPPQNVPSGGPAGADDNYLLATAVGGGGAGSRLAVINFQNQWAGDYIAAGVGAVGMDLINLGATDLAIRLVFADPTTGPPTNLAVTAPVLLPAGGGWRPAVFAIGPADLVAVQGDAVAALTNATEVRIIHNEDATWPPPVVTAQLGVDNVTAMTDLVPLSSASWGTVKSGYR